MKKIGAVCVLLLCLAGCSGKSQEIERGMALRSQLLRAKATTFDAAVTADYGDSLYEFSLHCQGDDLGDLRFTVTAPETIAGITGIIEDEGGQLTFEDTAVRFETMTDDQVSPVTAPWIFLKTLRSGCLTAAGLEGENLRLTIDDSYEDDALKLDIWLDESNTPKRAEVLCNGRRILTLQVINFEIS